MCGWGDGALLGVTWLVLAMWIGFRGLTHRDQLHVKECEHEGLSTIGFICMALGILIKPLQDLLDRIPWPKCV